VGLIVDLRDQPCSVGFRYLSEIRASPAHIQCPLYSRKRTCAVHPPMSALANSGHSRRVRPFIEKRYRRDVEHARARALCSDLVYWLARRSRTTIQIMVAIVSVPPRADASAQ